MKPYRSNTHGKYRFSVERWAVLLALAVVGLLIGILLLSGDPNGQLILESPKPAYASAAELELEHEHGAMDGGDHKKIYSCPMMCIPPTEKPGNCPVCGMALTLVVTGDNTSDNPRPRLSLTPQAVHLADIRTMPVKRMAVTNEVRLFGRIDFDSAHITKITAFMPGVIDRVHVKRAGQFVRWGDPLFDIYSSDLLETQRQLVAAMQYVPSFFAFQAGTPHVAQDAPVQARENHAAGSGHSELQTAALEKIKALRHKLSILGLPKRDIDQFMKKGEATGIATVYASMYGQITVQNATEGSFVNTGTALFTIADPKYVWARLDAYESDYPWIRIGQRITFSTEAYPGEVFESKVVYIDPVFDAATRTFSIGAITTADQGGRLKAGMLVRAVAHARLDTDGNIAGTSAARQQPPLTIPASAPLITGKRAVVYVVVPGDTPEFEGREVVLGPRAKDHYVVRDGLWEGEQVVVNGSFKIDSAMQILAKPSLMSSSGGVGGTGHELHGHHIPDYQAAAVAADASDHAPAADQGMGPSLADVHQHPDLSNRMNNDYMDQRRSSRTLTPTTVIHLPASEDGHVSPAVSVHDGSMPGHSLKPSEVQQHQRRQGIRRKPGQYGDTTRQGASLLEEHRKRWRRGSGNTD